MGIFRKNDNLDKVLSLKNELEDLINAPLIENDFRYGADDPYLEQKYNIINHCLQGIKVFFKLLKDNCIYSKYKSQELVSIYCKNDEYSGFNFFNKHYMCHTELDDGSLLIKYQREKNNSVEYYNEVIPAGLWVTRWETRQRVIRKYTPKEIDKIIEIRDKLYNFGDKK